MAQYFTIGAYIKPYRKSDGGWCWIVSSFEEGEFKDGEEINLRETAETLEELVED